LANSSCYAEEAAIEREREEGRWDGLGACSIAALVLTTREDAEALEKGTKMNVRRK
jgi:hypothetical protein